MNMSGMSGCSGYYTRLKKLIFNGNLAPTRHAERKNVSNPT